MKTEIMAGVPVDCLTYEDIIREVPMYIKTGEKMTAISVNPQIIVEGKKHPEVIEFIKNSTHRIPDGIGIVLVSKLTKGNIKQRVAGFELMIKFLEYANENCSSCFFYGAHPDVLKDMLRKLEIEYPKMNIAGSIDGYTSLKDEEIVDKINQVHPDFLFIALGFPKQEQWLNRNLDKLNVSIFQDVGGSFDVLSGHVKRAPAFFLRFHLEWLYRSLSNPRRIGRIFQLPVFLFKSLLWNLKNR
ncbi:N-acetylglucosaminyldiphosphoundecaprenol N-acetyl-beta-D-mannosaminyltransferase [Enterococcus sp. DIV2402]|uniref:N-acetylglucosaminyldiphosphoundecaprenol N-acetyl-beta-D-mannosaminyltransferase n=1 Tax=Candidatus Enterococcus lowellii TaxID=2230877 RepID=A0ABZ2SM19_9ENTE|nr:WecB/TagA/CpsF family glycosyltransferase [Enterococcus sp. DIV2402]MBO0464291.1 WecB/TagA/CpsF family glycosyltransferase [Enterococcus sp. DIV2402]